MVGRLEIGFRDLSGGGVCVSGMLYTCMEETSVGCVVSDLEGGLIAWGVL